MDLLCETLPFMVDIDEIYKVYQGKQDQTQAENQLCDVQQCPRNSKVPGIDGDEDLEGQSEEEDGGREVGEDRLVETSGEVWIVCVPSQVQVPEWGQAKGL